MFSKTFSIVVILSLAACTSGGVVLDAPSPIPAPAPVPAIARDSVRFESRPEGAVVKISSSQSCRTPCMLDLPVNHPSVVAFSLPGYLIVSKAVEPKVGTNPIQLEPNPVIVDFIVDPALKKKNAKKTAR